MYNLYIYIYIVHTLITKQHKFDWKYWCLFWIASYYIGFKYDLNYFVLLFDIEYVECKSNI